METAKIEIRVPKDMVLYINGGDQKKELERNALILYPYVKNLTLSHGKAAEILGINKLDLISLYNELGLSYLDMDICEVEEELRAYRGMREAGK